MKLPLFALLLSLFLFSSCGRDSDLLLESIEDEDRVFYVINTDTSVIVYKNGINTPFVFKTPLVYDEFVKADIPMYTITSVAGKGVHRFIGTEENSTYRMRNTPYIFLLVGLIIIFIAWIKK